MATKDRTDLLCPYSKCAARNSQLILLEKNSLEFRSYNDVNNQQDATTFSFINLFNSALHVSRDKFAYPQENFLTVYTAFGTASVV